ncbi:unnamed protein product, partial [Didymodactylos carnosus]
MEIWLLLLFNTFLVPLLTLTGPVVHDDDSDALHHLKTSNHPITNLETGILITHLGSYIHRANRKSTIAHVPVTAMECYLLSANTNLCSATTDSRTKRFGGLDMIHNSYKVYEIAKKGRNLFNRNDKSTDVSRIADQARVNQVASRNNTGQIFVITDENVKLASEVENMQNELLEIEEQLESDKWNDEVRTLVSRMTMSIRRLNSNILIRTVNDIQNRHFTVDFLLPNQQIELFKELYSQTKMNKFSNSFMLKLGIIDQSIDYIPDLVSNTTKNISSVDSNDKIVGKL